ncbi:DUF3560 domain-containing protein [Streptomyces sp. NPDC006482]|uniref:DUF3560 domain-containing protein n=1 Tax=Streptomyces sp. NPDC006482 TaxID=3154306 RepID=UPI0033B36920
MTNSHEAHYRARLAQERADALTAEADRRSAAASGMYERFSGGQPILLGHHSARGALRQRARADSATRRAIEVRAAAKNAQARANQARVVAELAETADQRGRAWRPADFQPGDVVEVRTFRTSVDLYRVKRVNRASLTLEGPGGGYDDPRREYSRVLARYRDDVRVTDPATLD